MDRTRLGTTDLRVTPIGLGLAALGRPGYINLGHADDLEGRRSVEALEQHTRAMLNQAWDAGIRYFDTARSYGKAEAFLGRWLRDRGITDPEVAVGSKWGYTYTADWQVDADVHEVKDHSLDVLRRQWPETRGHLDQHIDLYQIHSATLKTGVLEDETVHAELHRLKHTFGIAVGLSLSGPRQGETLEKALAVEVDGVPLFDTVQATWNLLERSAGPMLKAAHEDGRGVIIKEALANGRLTARNDEAAFADARAVLNAEADRLGATLDALALAGVLAQPWVDVVLSGAATANHLHSNVTAPSVEWDAAAADALDAIQEPAEAYWERRSALSWT